MRSVLMNLCQQMRQIAHFLRSDVVLVEQLSKPITRVELSHSHCVLDGRGSGGTDAQASIDQGDRHHVEIQVRSEPAIQSYLFLAIMLAQLERGGVEEIE